MSVNNHPSPFRRLDNSDNNGRENNNNSLTIRNVRVINKNSPNPFDWLPIEIVDHIFFFILSLSFKNLRLVCKSWNGFVLNSKFHTDSTAIERYFQLQKELKTEELILKRHEICSGNITCISVVSDQLFLVGTDKNKIFAFQSDGNSTYFKTTQPLITGLSSPPSLIWAEDAVTTGEFFSASSFNFMANSISVEGEIATIMNLPIMMNRFENSIKSPITAFTANPTALYTASEQEFIIWDRKTGSTLTSVTTENPITALAIHQNYLYVGMQALVNSTYLKTYHAADESTSTNYAVFDTSLEDYKLTGKDLDADDLKKQGLIGERVKGFSKVGNALIVQRNDHVLLIDKTKKLEERVNFKGLNASCGWGNLIVSHSDDQLFIWDPLSHKTLIEGDIRRIEGGIKFELLATIRRQIITISGAVVRIIRSQSLENALIEKEIIHNPGRRIYFKNNAGQEVSILYSQYVQLIKAQRKKDLNNNNE